jgi:hypothetical protein
VPVTATGRRILNRGCTPERSVHRVRCQSALAFAFLPTRLSYLSAGSHHSKIEDPCLAEMTSWSTRSRFRLLNPRRVDLSRYPPTRACTLSSMRRSGREPEGYTNYLKRVKRRILPFGSWRRAANNPLRAQKRSPRGVSWAAKRVGAGASRVRDRGPGRDCPPGRRRSGCPPHLARGGGAVLGILG